ncbi:hypothetical protein BDY21DRAFT_320555 [Lineolata rhizophorae]|uniref:Cell division control protein n=1 Tax=Lineolata rhizophorae TaxID=578093 RepID=A0A6A6P227_9PEZI|nr:hypothetical protein BDY21DRAFT_320555 [Lineolata rhizophorae]
MPGTVSETPQVPLSFANNFWGKDDAGVAPLLDRMHNAKVTCDELKSFYNARTAIEDEYSRKLLSLARKPLGSSEAGTLRMSLDVVRAEVESMGKAHQKIATQMKRDLDEPLVAHAGGMKERRKIIQGGIEKLLKTKTQQTVAVNKSRDKFEQDCLKIKGYLAQTHMVMGQEERKNKAKLEKTRIQMSTASNEYENAVKLLEETTGLWNRDWKLACDKFQDLEEERIEFMKSSLWTFANIASSVCVSDDESCERIRLSLEDLDVNKDITTFIQQQGTGQEIPDPPKFINFCRGDIDETDGEHSDDGGYSTAQFQRQMNPAMRTSSPQPSLFESHHDPDSPLAREYGHKEPPPQQPPPQNAPPNQSTNPPPAQSKGNRVEMRGGAPPMQPQQSQMENIPRIPYNEHPMDGMTQFCRFDPPSGRSSVASPNRPSSRDDSQSEYSNPTSFSSMEPPSGNQSPTKQIGGGPSMSEQQQLQKRKSGFFNSPFRRRSRHEKEQPQTGPMTAPSSRNTWGPSAASSQGGNNVGGFGGSGGRARGRNFIENGREQHTASPEPVDPRANFQLNIGNNVFDVESPDARQQPQARAAPNDELDPIAQALAELKGVTKQSSQRVSADRFHGLSTPIPPGTPSMANTPSSSLSTPLASASALQGRTPPPSYEAPVSRLGAPQPAHTARQMKKTTQMYQDKTASMFNGSGGGAGRSAGSRPPTRGSSNQSQEVVRATSPAPGRPTSPRPGLYEPQQRTLPQQQQPAPQQTFRATSPNPYASNAVGRPRAQSSSPIKPRGGDGYGSYGRAGGTASMASSPGHTAQQASRPVSPQPHFGSSAGISRGSVDMRATSPQPHFGRMDQRPGSSRGGDMALALAQSEGSVYGGSQRGRNGGNGRPMSSYYGSGNQGGADGGYQGGGQLTTRVRSKSVAEPRQFTKDGRPILHFARAMYMYQAAIPEELSFVKGDTLAILRHQDDGWWEAEVVGKRGSPGLVPSNYLQAC